MIKQFLLNPDGSVPAGVDLELLAAEDIPLVWPTPAPMQSGMIAVEQDPEQHADGTWHQVWVLHPAPEPEPLAALPADPLATLTPDQKAALLALLQI